MGLYYTYIMAFYLLYAYIMPFTFYPRIYLYFFNLRQQLQSYTIKFFELKLREAEENVKY